VLLVLAAACSQNVEGVNDPTRIEETPLPPQPGGNPLAIAPSATEVAGGAAMVGGEAESGMDDEVPPFVKAYFMHMWVEALYSTPQNNNPNPDWESPLTDPVNGRVWCTDCHVSGQVDFENIPKQRLPLTDVYERQAGAAGGLSHLSRDRSRSGIALSAGSDQGAAASSRRRRAIRVSSSSASGSSPVLIV
jgi:hypothetical protein